MPRISELDPLPWQTEFLRAGLSGDWPSDAAAVRGGLGSGKSLALCALAILICETRPGALVVVGMDTFRRLRDVHLPHLHGLLAGSAVTFAASNRKGCTIQDSGYRIMRRGTYPAPCILYLASIISNKEQGISERRLRGARTRPSLAGVAATLPTACPLALWSENVHGLQIL